MEKVQVTLPAVLGKAIVVHTVTYFIVGVLALIFLDYTTWFSGSELGSLMRPTDDPLVAAGPLFQPLRGILFGIVFYLLRDVFFSNERGWVTMWIVLVFLGILSTFGPSPGSIEGFVYTKLSIGSQLFGLIEILTQSFLLAFVTFYWIQHSKQRWLTWLLIGLFALIVLLSTLGVLFGGAK